MDSPERMDSLEPMHSLERMDSLEPMHSPASRPIAPPMRRAIVLALGLTIALSAAACTTRTVNDPIIDRHGLEVRLRAQKKLLGSRIDRGFQHPTIIAPERLANILRAIEVDVPKEKDSLIRERRPAISEELLPRISEGLSEAFAQAEGSQEIVVLALRKQASTGIFTRKFLTSFIAYMRDDRLYLLLSRLDWPTELRKRQVGVGQEEYIPEPWADEHPMNFTVVVNQHYRAAGRQGVEVRWRDPIFSRALTLPGAVDRELGRKEILGSEPVPEAELREAPTSGDRAPSIEGLSADSLRKLADLEDARAAGEITEGEYLRERDRLMGLR